MTLTLVSALLVLIAVASAYGSHPQYRINPHREHVVRALNRGLFGTPMANTGRELEAAGHKHGVNPALIAAISGVESSYGAAPCHPNTRNVWGLSSCGSGWYVPFFRSWASAYDFVARFVRRQWPAARSPYDLHGYCVTGGHDCPGWADGVVSNMRRFGSGPTVAYR